MPRCGMCSLCLKFVLLDKHDCACDVLLNASVGALLPGKYRKYTPNCPYIYI